MLLCKGSWFPCLELAVEVSVELLSLSLHHDPVDLVVDLCGVEHESIDVEEDALGDVNNHGFIASRMGCFKA